MTELEAGAHTDLPESQTIAQLADAVERLRGLPTPFTLSQARQALDTTRRVTVPIMELLARRGSSRQLPDGTHELL